MKSLFILLLLLPLTVFSQPQAPDTLWTRTYGGSENDFGRSVKQTEDGGYIIAGLTESYGAGSYDIYLIKTDSNGNEIWSQTYGGHDYDYGNSVLQTTDGGYVIVGYTLSFGAGGNDNNVYIIKTDANGDTLWTKSFGGIYLDRGSSVQQTADGGYIITGYTLSFGTGNIDIYLIKIDEAGNEIWSSIIDGNSNEYGNFVQQNEEGGYIIVGYIGFYPNYNIMASWVTGENIIHFVNCSI